MTDRFAPIGDIPADLPGGLTPILQAMKQNIEMLAGQTGVDKLSQAVTFGAVTVKDVTQDSTAAVGAAPTAAEFLKTVTDITQLTEAHNYLANQLRGEKAGS